MQRQKIFRILVFAIIVGGIIFALSRHAEEQGQEEKKVLPAQVERVIEELKDLPDETGLSSLKEKVLGSFKQKSKEVELERKIEEKVEELIEEIKSLPEEQLEELKKEVFCTEVCEKTCQEICE